MAKRKPTRPGKRTTGQWNRLTKPNLIAEIERLEDKVHSMEQSLAKHKVSVAETKKRDRKYSAMFGMLDGIHKIFDKPNIKRKLFDDPIDKDIENFMIYAKENEYDLATEIDFEHIRGINPRSPEFSQFVVAYYGFIIQKQMRAQEKHRLNNGKLEDEHKKLEGEHKKLKGKYGKLEDEHKKLEDDLISIEQCFPPELKGNAEIGTLKKLAMYCQSIDTLLTTLPGYQPAFNKVVKDIDNRIERARTEDERQELEKLRDTPGYIHQEVLKKLIQVYINTSEQNQRKTDELVKKGNKHLEQIIELKVEMASCYAQLGKLPEMRKYRDAAIRLGAEKKVILNELNNNLLKYLSQLDNEQANSPDKKDLLYEKQKDVLTLADEQYREAIDKGDNSFLTLHNCGDVNLRLCWLNGNDKSYARRAIIMYESALKVDSDGYWTNFNLANAHKITGNDEKAEKYQRIANELKEQKNVK